MKKSYYMIDPDSNFNNANALKLDTLYISSNKFPRLRINAKQNKFSILRLNIRSIKHSF